MNKLQNNEQGLGAIWAIAVVAGVVLVMLIGWMVYNSQNKTSKPESQPKTALHFKGLSPADSDLPTAGICGSSNHATATVTYHLDTPDPRCLKVKAEQSLIIANPTDQRLNVTYAGKQFSIEPKSNYKIDQTFGSYLQKGVHLIQFTPSSAADIWLQ